MKYNQGHELPSSGLPFAWVEENVSLQPPGDEGYDV